MRGKTIGKTIAKDLAYDVVSAFLQGIGTYCFIASSNMAPGGVSGIAILINYLTGFPIGTMTFLLNIPLLILSYLFLGRKLTVKTVCTVGVTSLILDFLVAPYFPEYMGDRLMSAAFGGIFSGIGLALVFMRGSTTGGGDIVAKLLRMKFPHFQMGYAIMLTDLVVVGVSALVFQNIESAMYGLICMVCSTQTIDAILYGMNKGTMITIVSPKNREIAAEILKQLNRGATFLKGRGAYSKKDCETLLCVVDKKQFYQVKEIIDSFDQNAFVIVSETKEVYGEGFLEETPF